MWEAGKTSFAQMQSQQCSSLMTYGTAKCAQPLPASVSISKYWQPLGNKACGPKARQSCSSPVLACGEAMLLCCGSFAMHALQKEELPPDLKVIPSIKHAHVATLWQKATNMHSVAPSESK